MLPINLYGKLKYANENFFNSFKPIERGREGAKTAKGRQTDMTFGMRFQVK